MRQRLIYDIAVRKDNATWSSVVRGDEVFSRSPEEVARSVLESWIIEHPEQLAGGERVLIPTEQRAYDEDRITATVRVQLFESKEESGAPVIVGYLGHDRRDYTGGFSAVARTVGPRAREYASSVRDSVARHRGKAATAGVVSLLAGLFALRKARARSGRRAG